MTKGKSFVPDSIRLWNLLKAEAREAISINSFRKNISVEIANPPSYYAFGKHFINIIHTKLRHKCILHYDLYKRNTCITNSPFCSCGQNEDFYHFFFACNFFSKARNNLFNRLLCLTWSILIQIYAEMCICLCRSI